ncbi:unnamed protein product [Rhodiola kirilowii]
MQVEFDALLCNGTWDIVRHLVMLTLLVVSGCTGSSANLMVLLSATRRAWWQRDLIKKKALIILIHSVHW